MQLETKYKGDLDNPIITRLNKNDIKAIAQESAEAIYDKLEQVPGLLPTGITQDYLQQARMITVMAMLIQSKLCR